MLKQRGGGDEGGGRGRGGGGGGELHYTLFMARHKNNNTNNKDKRLLEAADTFFQFRPRITELAGRVSPGNVEQDDSEVPHSAAKFASFFFNLKPEHFKPLLVADAGIAPPNPTPLLAALRLIVRVIHVQSDPLSSQSFHLHADVECERNCRLPRLFSPQLGFINAATPHSNCAVRPKNASAKSTTACLLRDAWPRTCSRLPQLRIYVANPPFFNLIYFFFRR